MKRRKGAKEPTPQEAARLHAEANRTDPFAYQRALLHMEKGIAYVADIAADARRQLEARGK